MDLTKLGQCLNNNENYEKELDAVLATCATEEERQAVIDFVTSKIEAQSAEIDSFIEETRIKIQLSEISKMVSLSYIAKEYFHKSRNWLYQKINGSNVNGKPARFTPDEINTLNIALQDIGRKIGSTFISI